MLTLYQFPISHFCEVVRWALDYKKLAYRKVNLLPGAHVKVVTRMAPASSVPVLQHDQVYVQNASDILSYLDRQFPPSTLTPVNSGEKQAAMEWEKYLQREIGVHLRRFYYHYLLQHPRSVIPLWCQDGPWLGYWRLRLIYPVLKRRMRQFMSIDAATATASRAALVRAIGRLENAYGRSRFLVGGRFGRADITAAAMVAPVFQPPAYGLVWPARAPAPVQDFFDEQRSRLGWAEALYRDYRPGPPQR